MKKTLLAFLFSTVFFAAQAQNTEAKIQELLKHTEEVMGGKAAFDKIENISWNFFGLRILTWNKKTNDVRIDFLNENSIYLVNVGSKKGKIIKHGVEVSQADSLAKYVNAAYEIWVNDSYWLAMPFKLRDPGVKHEYAGEMTDKLGNRCQTIILTFEGTGVTPQNKYLVYIDKKTGLVCQWEYFKNNTDMTPVLSSQWLDYKRIDNVLISVTRDDRTLEPVRIFKKLPAEVYTQFDRPFFLRRL